MSVLPPQTAAQKCIIWIFQQPRTGWQKEPPSQVWSSLLFSSYYHSLQSLFTAHISFSGPPHPGSSAVPILNTLWFSQTRIKFLLCAIRIKKTPKHMSRFQILAAPIKRVSPEEHELQVRLSRAEHNFSSSHCSWKCKTSASLLFFILINTYIFQEKDT